MSSIPAAPGWNCCASRTTARRYLEYLTSTGTLKTDIHYGGVGRPERRYGVVG